MCTHLKVDDDGECTGGSETKGLVVPFIAIREDIEGHNQKEDKEKHYGNIDTLYQTAHKYSFVEIEVLLPSDIKLWVPIAVVFIYILTITKKKTTRWMQEYAHMNARTHMEWMNDECINKPDQKCPTPEQATKCIRHCRSRCRSSHTESACDKEIGILLLRLHTFTL